MNIAFCVDRNFLMQTAVAARSAVESTNAFIRFHILAPDVDQDLWDLFLRSLPDRCAVTHWPISLDFASGLTTVDNIPVVSYSWLLLTSLLPLEVDKILYLDADILVQGDLAALYATKLDGFLLAAVQDQGEFIVGKAMRNWRDLRLPAESPYCNNGVLLFEPERWRVSNVSEKVLAFARTHSGNLHYGDQCALNAIVHDQWKALPAKYNVQSPLVRRRDGWCEVFLHPDQVAEALDNPVLTHFTGTMKPWSDGQSVSTYSAWYDVLDRTSWSGWRPTITTLPLMTKFRNRAQRVLRVALRGS